MLISLGKSAINFTSAIIKAITHVLKLHRVVGWFLLIINFGILSLMTYHLLYGWGKTILETDDIDESSIARHKWLLLFGDNGYFFVFALIFNIFLMRFTVKYVYKTIADNFGTTSRDSVHIRQLLNDYGIMKW